MRTWLMLLFPLQTPKSLSLITKLFWLAIPWYALCVSIHQRSLKYLSYLLWFYTAAILFRIIDKYNLNPGYKFFILLAIWLSIAGRVSFYENIIYYDKMLHFLTPYLIACITYDFCLRSGKGPLCSVCIATGLLIFFELFEYFLDKFQFFQFNTRGVYGINGQVLMAPMMDTILDLGIGMLATLVAVMWKRKDSHTVRTEFQFGSKHKTNGVEVDHL